MVHLSRIPRLLYSGIRNYPFENIPVRGNDIALVKPVHPYQMTLRFFCPKAAWNPC